MFRSIATFYLLGIVLCFALTIYAGASGASFVQVFSVAILAWPASFFLLLLNRQVARIRSRDFRH